MTAAELHTLLELQKKDLTLLQLKKESQEIPVRKDAAAAKASGERERMAKAKERVTASEAAIKQVELDVEAVRERIAKYKTQQMDSKTNEEYKTFNHEIELAEEKIGGLEDVELEEMSRLEDAKAEVEQASLALEAAEGMVEQLVAELDARMETIRSTFAEVKAERETLAKELHSDILERYMILLTKKQEAVVVPIRQECCGGCHMKLSPQILHDAHSGQKWTACGFCGRMLYDPEI